MKFTFWYVLIFPELIKTHSSFKLISTTIMFPQRPNSHIFQDTFFCTSASSKKLLLKFVPIERGQYLFQLTSFFLQKTDHIWNLRFSKKEVFKQLWKNYLQTSLNVSTISVNNKWKRTKLLSPFGHSKANLDSFATRLRKTSYNTFFIKICACYLISWICLQYFVWTLSRETYFHL